MLCADNETHAGQVFTCVAALAIADGLHHVDTDLLSWWYANYSLPHMFAIPKFSGRDAWLLHSHVKCHGPLSHEALACMLLQSAAFAVPMQSHATSRKPQLI